MTKAFFNHGNVDAYIVKLSSNGDLEWQKCIGGKDFDGASSILLLPDGGYIFGGSTTSTDGDASGSGNHGLSDVWLVKLTSSGVVRWQKCYGGSSYDGDWQGSADGYSRRVSIIPTYEGGYAVSTFTNSNDGDVSGLHRNPSGGLDIWACKIDSMGTMQWQKCFGSDGGESTNAITQTSDLGYAIVGVTYSYDGDSDGDVSGTHTENGFIISDMWVIKLTSTGSLQWQKCLGGKFDDYGSGIIQTADNKYVILGWTQSGDGDVTGNHGPGNPYVSLFMPDLWLVKLGLPSSVGSESQPIKKLDLSSFPNPAVKSLTLHYSLPQASKVDITIYTITGQKVQEIHAGYEASGQHEAILNLTKLASGSYFVTVTADGISETVQVEVVK